MELPERLEIATCTNRGESCVLGRLGEPLEIVVSGGSFEFNRDLAVALVESYNKIAAFKASAAKLAEEASRLGY